MSERIPRNGIGGLRCDCGAPERALIEDGHRLVCAECFASYEMAGDDRIDPASGLRRTSTLSEGIPVGNDGEPEAGA